jgi:hypothetical protein
VTQSVGSWSTVPADLLAYCAKRELPSASEPRPGDTNKERPKGCWYLHTYLHTYGNENETENIGSAAADGVLRLQMVADPQCVLQDADPQCVVQDADMGPIMFLDAGNSVLSAL